MSDIEVVPMYHSSQEELETTIIDNTAAGTCADNRWNFLESHAIVTSFQKHDLQHNVYVYINILTKYSTHWIQLQLLSHTGAH